MSTIPARSDSQRLRELIEEAFPGRLANVTANDQPEGQVEFVFRPALRGTEEEALADLVALSRGNLSITPSEFRALRSTFAGLREYHALDSPTAAQTVAAVKAIIRTLRAMLRDEEASEQR